MYKMYERALMLLIAGQKDWIKNAYFCGDLHNA